MVASSLSVALKDLKQRWADTQEEWSDSVSRKFEEEHLAPIEPQVLATLKAVNRLNQVLARAYEECT